MSLRESVLAGHLYASGRVTAIHGHTEPLLGLLALLELPGSWRVGGAGFFLAGGAELRTSGPLAGSQLHMGYGGIVIEHSLRDLAGAPLSTLRSPSLRVRVLAGMGNASVRDPVARARFLSDNFFVLDPTLLLAAPLGSSFGAAALVAYRIVMGVKDLGEVNEAELRGWSLGMSFHLGPF